ncbi:MAG: putative DNA binding domain-containing protein [Nitrospirota bacterium]
MIIGRQVIPLPDKQAAKGRVPCYSTNRAMGVCSADSIEPSFYKQFPDFLVQSSSDIAFYKPPVLCYTYHMLSADDIKNKIEIWETHDTEFKSEISTSSKDRIRETIVAFANDYSEIGGGTIIIGVDSNTRLITGLSDEPEETLRQLSDICRDGAVVPMLYPEIYHITLPEGHVAVVEIRKSVRRPHRAKNICYVRVGPTTRKATPDEEFELTRRSGRQPYDMLPLRDVSTEVISLAKFEQEFLPRRIAQETIAYNGRTAMQWAEHLKFLIKEGDKLVPTVAAVLLFGRNPHEILPNSSIDFILFKGTDPSYPIQSRQELMGTSDELIKGATEIVKRFMMKGYLFEEQYPRRKDIFEYPWGAVREAIANAVIHRDYETSRTTISVKMFDDRLEILSPGGLFGIVTKENFGTGVNDYRNPTLAVNLNLLELVEKAGTGIPKIKRGMEENGSGHPIFDIHDTYLLVKLPGHPYYIGARYYERGLVEFEKGNKDEAKGLFLKAVKIADNFSEAWVALGRLEALYGSVDNARECFIKAIEFHPRFERAYLEWGRFEEQAGYVDKSRDIFRHGTEALPQSAALWHSWALLENKTKNTKKADILIRKAVSLQPEDPKLLRTYGKIAFALSKWNEAIIAFRKALSYSNDKGEDQIWLRLMKSLINIDAPLKDVKECFDASYNLNHRPRELFDRYYNYLTSIGLHADALNIIELARAERIRIQPALPSIYVGNIPAKHANEQIEVELKKLFKNIDIEITKLSIFNGKGFARITVATAADVQKAVAELKNAELFGNKISIKLWK